MKKLLLLSCLLAILPAFVSGQAFSRKNRYFSFGGNINSMNYVGEVDPGPSFLSPAIRYTRYNLGATFLYRYSPRVSYRANISYGRIAGDDYENANYSEKNIYRKFRNLSFANHIFEVKADVVIDLFENRSKFTKRPDYTPYLFFGIAYFNHNPIAKLPEEFGGDKVNLRELSTEGQGLEGGANPYSLHQIAIPIGIGFRYKLAKHWDLAFEIGWRFTTTDYLDDIGGEYYDAATLNDAKGELAVAMADRTYEGYLSDVRVQQEAIARYGGNGLSDNTVGDPRITGFGFAGDQRGDLKGRRDLYVVSGFHLTYIIPGKVICPKFR